VKQEFKDYFNFDDHFYVLDCRSSRGSEMRKFRAALVAHHDRLHAESPRVPKICKLILDSMGKLRAAHSNDPIITIREMLDHCRVNVTKVYRDICRCGA
jgi:hypothetical protein